MDKKQYLYELSKQLKDLSNEEYNEALCFVEEYFEEAGPENEQRIISELGTPEKYAAQIKAESVIKGQHQSKEEKSTKSSMKTLWVIILGICALPLAAPLLFAALAVIFAILLCIFVFVLAGGIIIFAAIIGFIPLFISSFALFTIHAPSGILAFGSSIVLLGVIMLGVSFYYLIITKAVPTILQFTASMFSKLKNKIQRRDSI